MRLDWLTTLSVALLAACLLPAPARAAEARVKEALDLRYAEGGGDRHDLDVFYPEGAKGRPVVVLVHGGSWMFGDKNFFGLNRAVGRGLAGQGLVVVMPNYRLTPWVRHPEHVKDVARAFAWARAHAGDYGGDPGSIFLVGHSAGGHLVSLLATDPTYLKDPELRLSDADRRAIRGVVGVSGVYAIPPPEEFARVAEKTLAGLAMGAGARGAMPGPASPLLRRTGLLLNPFRLVFGSDREQLRLASPVAHVRPGLPPFLLLYAEDELPLLGDMAKSFAGALRGAKNEVELTRVDGRNHNSILFQAANADDPVARAILKFVGGNRH